MGWKFTTVVGKTGQRFTYDWDSLPEASKLYIIQYGFDQSVGQDSHAAATEKKFPVASERKAEAVKLATARDAAVRAGTMGQGRSGVVATLAAEIEKLRAEIAARDAAMAATESPKAKRG